MIDKLYVCWNDTEIQFSLKSEFNILNTKKMQTFKSYLKRKMIAIIS